MKALRIEESGLGVFDIPPPSANGEVLVRVLRSGICNTDLEIARGYAGFRGTLGHEFVGVVESAKSHLAGRRVVGEINVGCGACQLCRSGDPRHCPGRTVLGIHGRDGAHAEFLKLPESNLLEVPDEISDDEAVFVEPLAASLAIAEQISIGRDTRVAVVGDGKLGILCARSISPLTSGLTLVGKHRSKLDQASRGGGNIETVLSKDADDLHGLFEIVVEASGSESGFAVALDLLRPRGKLVLKSTFHGTTRWEASRAVVDEITIVGSRCGRFAPAIELLMNRGVNVDDLISQEYRLSDGVHAMERAAEKGVLKVILRT